MAVRGPGGRFRSPTQTEAVTGQGTPFAQLIATMQIDDEFYRAELAKLETDTKASVARINQTFSATAIAANDGTRAVRKLGEAARTAAFIAAGQFSNVSNTISRLTTQIGIFAILLGAPTVGLVALLAGVGIAAGAAFYTWFTGADRVNAIMEETKKKTEEAAVAMRALQSSQRTRFGEVARGPRGSILEGTLDIPAERAQAVFDAAIKDPVNFGIAFLEGMMGERPIRAIEFLNAAQEEQNKRDIAKQKRLADAIDAQYESRIQFEQEMSDNLQSWEADIRTEGSRRFESILAGARERFDAVNRFRVEVGLAKPSSLIDDPLERALQEFRERQAEITGRAFRPVTVRQTPTFSFGRGAPSGTFGLGSQTITDDVERAQLRVQSEALQVLKELKFLILGRKPVGTGVSISLGP